MLEARFHRALFAASVILAIATHLAAQSSCSATNDNQDQNCSISCPAGQAAQCSNGVASSPPSCTCSGVPEGIFASNSRIRWMGKSGFISATEKTLRMAGAREPMALKQLAPGPTIETTNVIDVINSKLSSLPDHHISDSCHLEPANGPGVGPIVPFPGLPPIFQHVMQFKRVCQPVNGKLSVLSPLLVTDGPTVKIGTPNWANIPADVYEQHATYTNCSAAQQSESFQHSVVMTVGETIANTHALMTGSSQSISVNGGLHVGIVSFGASASLAVNTQTTLSDTDTHSQSQQETNSVTLPLIVPAMTRITLSHAFIQYQVPIPFTGFVTVDGSVSQNLDGVSHLSQILPSAADRTFSFAGQVTDSTLIDANTTTTSKTLTQQDCASQQGAMVVSQ